MLKENKTMKPFPYRLAVLILAVSFFFIAGCAGTKPPTFYSLSSTAVQDAGHGFTPGGRGLLIAAGHVDIPEILNRPHLVFYKEGNRVEFLEYDRWAGDLRDALARVFMEDLSSSLAKDGIPVVSWREHVDADYRVDIHVISFGSVSDTEAVLQARWTVFDLDGKKAVHIQESYITEAIEGSGPSASVAAMSRAVASLSREVAGFIRNMPSD